MFNPSAKTSSGSHLSGPVGICWPYATLYSTPSTQSHKMQVLAHFPGPKCYRLFSALESLMGFFTPGSRHEQKVVVNSSANRWLWCSILDVLFVSELGTPARTWGIHEQPLLCVRRRVEHTEYQALYVICNRIVSSSYCTSPLIGPFRISLVQSG